MIPSKFATVLYVLVGSVIPLVSSITVPGASTPSFYFVSSSTNSAVNLLPLRLNGGATGYSTLGGTGPIGEFYFFQGTLTAANPAGSGPTSQAVMASLETLCTSYGPFGFSTPGGNTDKCAVFTPTSLFQIQSDTANSQLGASLAFNFTGGFYACNNDVWYKVNAGDGPTGCSAISLFTVPVSPVP